MPSFGRCFNSETNYTKSPNISAKVNFCKFSTILLARNTYEGTTRFTLSRKPTWISFKRRCCGNLCQLIMVDVWNTCGRSQTPKLRGLHSLSDKKLCFEPSTHASFQFHRKGLCGDHDNPNFSWSRTDCSVQPVVSVANNFPSFLRRILRHTFYTFTVWVDLRDYW